MDGALLKARPFLTLSFSFLLMICAGTVYWFPAIAPGLAVTLNLTQWQATAVIAAANTGSVFGILGGLVHEVCGSRVSAALASLGLSMCYMTLAVLHEFAYINSMLMFGIVLFVVTAIVTFSYTLYSSAVAASVSLFPIRYRGRVVGLNATMYGGSAGVMASIQAVFFPSVYHAPANLLFVALICLIGGAIAWIMFPRKARYDPDSLTLDPDENAPLNTAATPPWHPHITTRLNVAYRVAFAFLVCLQMSAVSSIWHWSYWSELLTMVLVLISAMCILILPASSGLRIYARSAQTDENTAAATGNASTPDEEQGNSNVANEPSLWTALSDPRGLYLEAGFILLVGGSGMFLLVQASYLIESMHFGLYAVWPDVPVHVIVRSIVTLFSACNVTGRLATGAVIDRGDSIVDRLTWTFLLLRADFILMAVAMLLLTIPSDIAVLCGVVGIGFAYGSWFSTSPTLTTLWFGVYSFPRNFALYGACGLISSLTLNSTVPGLLRRLFGTWYDVKPNGAPEVVCVGIWCRAPALVMMATFLLGMYVLGGYLEPLVKRKAQTVIY